LHEDAREVITGPLDSNSDGERCPLTVNAHHTVRRYPRKAIIYRQGAIADAVYYLREGRIRLSVASVRGKEVTIAILEPGSFFGEGCLIGLGRSASAIAMVQSEVMRLNQREMKRALHEDTTFAEAFLHHVLARNSRIEDDLIDQLFNSSEKRLARTLLLLAHFERKGGPQPITIPISHEILAEIIGTTRPRVSHFMTKFRKLGFISYDGGGLRVYSSLMLILKDSK
jgi:CRP/FNR family cyclic AMP-dependent transcriptional regulator